MKGNRRYVNGVTKRHDFTHEREALSTLTAENHAEFVRFVIAAHP
jgi:hypothetical protein